ncbi:MAG: phosphoribosylformylglycinamidine synthase subunit PurL [Opitutales bacterium]
MAIDNSLMTHTAFPANPDPLLNVSITQDLVRKHGLLAEEYDRIVVILGREPTLTELGIFSVMWSEHCSYKNSRPLLKQFPVEKEDKKAPFGAILVKAGEENAGVVDIGGGWAVCFKIESHNHPSAVEPFEGAATGVGGIIRDIFTMGARPALLTNSLRFGDLESESVKRIFRGVVSGIAHYGNCIGIPNVGGDIYFDEAYEGNPLVNALCLGVLRHDQIKRGAASGVGNPVYYVGAATGRDGLGGASFASRELSEESQADRPAVQKGDPFMEKLLMEACLEMMEVPGLVVGIQDMGAAGLTCSTCETAGRGSTGIEIELDKVPQREAGMNSYEIMLSESQERMLVIVEKGREEEIEAIFSKWDLHAAHIGEVTEGDRMLVRHGGVPVADIPAKALTDEGPVYRREFKRPSHLEAVQKWREDDLEDLNGDSLRLALPLLLGHPTIASKRWVYRQYDHMVQAGTVVHPGSDAAVVRLRLDDRDAFIAIANDCNGRYCYLNPYRGGMIAMIEAMRNLACSGAVPLAMTDNLNFGNPYKPEVFYSMKESVRGLAEVCSAFDVPVVGGNVSLYNEHTQGAIDPTPVVSVVGLIKDPSHITRQFCRKEDETLILLGGYADELGGSAYLGVCHSLKTGNAPQVNLSREKKLHDFLRRLIESGHIVAAHDVSEGGLLVTVCEMLFGEEKTLGADLLFKNMEEKQQRYDTLLFGESQGRIVISVKLEAVAAVLADAKKGGAPARVIGIVKEEPFLNVLFEKEGVGGEWPMEELRQKWENSIGDAMKFSPLPG